MSSFSLLRELRKMYTLPSLFHVDVWLFSLERSPDEIAFYYATLSTEEQTKAQQFYFPNDRNSYIASHGIMRSLLANYLDGNPATIHYEYNAYGKPSVPNASIHFNLSHSGSLACLAVSMNPVGVDIERMIPLDNYLALADHFLSTQERHLFQTLPPEAHQLAFYRAWTRKEAYIKGIGMGLSYPVDQVTISLHERAQLLEDRANPNNEHRWNLMSFEHDRYIGAVTVPKNEYMECNIHFM
jgi:4'-phosphopantetheinyl transferase